jgi:hypothetical protein
VADRLLPIDGVDRYVDRGLVYQNASFTGSTTTWKPTTAGATTAGRGGDCGGLASIDVIKVLQVETTRLALERRGIRVDALHLEHAGIDEALSEHGLQWADLGLRGATLFYRRRVEDMPVADMPEGVDAARRAKVETTRRRILDKAMLKYRFRPTRNARGF